MNRGSVPEYSRSLRSLHLPWCQPPGDDDLAHWDPPRRDVGIPVLARASASGSTHSKDARADRAQLPHIAPFLLDLGDPLVVSPAGRPPLPKLSERIRAAPRGVEDSCEALGSPRTSIARLRGGRGIYNGFAGSALAASGLAPSGPPARRAPGQGGRGSVPVFLVQVFHGSAILRMVSRRSPSQRRGALHVQPARAGAVRVERVCVRRTGGR